MSNDKVYEIVTEKIIASLEAGTVPWHKPWAGGEQGLPRSMSNGRIYRGINTWLLMMSAEASGYGSRWWGTFKNIQSKGGQVRKGEKSTLVVFWKPLTKTDPKTGDEKRFFMLRYFNVFNPEQADWPDGMPARYAPPAFEDALAFDPVVEAERVLDRYLVEGGPALRHVRGDKAFYMPSIDAITLPERSQFATPHGYYSVAFHEAGHSTGHKDRLAREGVTDAQLFGSHGYAKEELVAEMTAAMLCGVTGCDLEGIDRSAAYINNWLRVFRGDKKMLVGAASAAQRAADLITFGEPAAADAGDTMEVAAA